MYKKQNRLGFRFIDGPYYRALFVDNQHVLRENEVIENANQKGYKVHRHIFNFTEYRDIIYGANRSMNRFHLLQNPAYQNIPRTISNIFLNSSLDGGFIKTTIINSLSDESFEINLDTNMHHIETARNDYLDVSEYLTHETKAQNIVALYERFVQAEEDQKELAWNVGVSYNLAREKERELVEKQKNAKEQIKEQLDKIEKIREDFNTHERRLLDNLSRVKGDIEKANKLEKDYAARQIQQLLQEEQNKPDYERELSQIKSQLRLLTAELQDLENQYQSDKRNIEIQRQQHVLDFENSQIKNKEDLQNELTKNSFDYYEAREQLTNDFNGRLEELHQRKYKVDGKIIKVKSSLENIHERPFLLKDKEKQHQKQQDLIREKNDLISQIKTAEGQKENSIREGKREIELLEVISNNEIDKLKQDKNRLEKEIEKTQSDLHALSGSLFEFLEENNPGWEKSVGKVISRELLFHNDLQPSISDGNNFYGVNLKLGQLETVIISKSDLEIRLKSLKQKLVDSDRIIESRIQALQDEKDKILKKFNKKISDFKQEINNCTLQLDKKDIGLEKCG